MNKILLFNAFFIIIHLSCKTKHREALELEITDINLIYTKPDVVSNLDSSLQFDSYIFIQIGFLIKNGEQSKKTIGLNNLRSKNYTFNIGMTWEGHDYISFFNYPFSGSFYPVKNLQVIEPYDSIKLNLQSPLIYYIKNATKIQIDSLFLTLKKSKFNLELNQSNGTKLFFNNSHKTFNLIPISSVPFSIIAERHASEVN